MKINFTLGQNLDLFENFKISKKVEPGVLVHVGRRHQNLKTHKICFFLIFQLCYKILILKKKNSFNVLVLDDFY